MSWLFFFFYKKVTFKAGHQLQFLFHSDSSNTEWGYKFTVTAFGLPPTSVSWISDLQLIVSRLMGRLASRTMALKSTHGTIWVFPLDASSLSYHDSYYIHNPSSCYVKVICFSMACCFFGFSEVPSVKELPAAVMNHVISSPLWKPLFTHGLSGPARSREPERCSNDTLQVQALKSTAY